MIGNFIVFPFVVWPTAATLQQPPCAQPSVEVASLRFNSKVIEDIVMHNEDRCCKAFLTRESLSLSLSEPKWNKRNVPNSKKAAGAQLECEACTYVCVLILAENEWIFRKWCYSPSTMRPSERMHLTLPLGASEATIDEELKVKQAWRTQASDCFKSERHWPCGLTASRNKLRLRVRTPTETESSSK